MSDVNPKPEEPVEAGSASGGSSPWFMIRMVVLLSIFGLALVGLLYDYCIARPGLKDADELVKGLLDGTVEDPDGDRLVTDTEVQSLLGREPSDTEQLPNAKREVYSWISGLPTRKYELWVSYTGGAQLPSGGRLWLLHAAATSKDKLDMPAVTQPVREMTEEELDNFVPKTPGAAGGGGGPGGPGARSAPGGGEGGEMKGKGKGKFRPKGPGKPDEAPQDPGVKEAGTKEPETKEAETKEAATDAPKVVEAEKKAAVEPPQDATDTIEPPETDVTAPKTTAKTIEAPDTGIEGPVDMPAGKNPRPALPDKPAVVKEPALKEKAAPETPTVGLPRDPKPAQPETAEEKGTPVKEPPTKEEPAKKLPAKAETGKAKSAEAAK